MKLLLFNPPQPFETPLPTLALGYLSSAAKQAGHESKIIDLWTTTIQDNKLKKSIKEYNPDLIGITLYSRRYNSTKGLTEKINAWFPNIPIVLGGPHPSAMPDETFKDFKMVNYLVIGEGEVTIVDLLNNMNKNISKIDGLCYRQNGHIIYNQERSFIRDLDSLPFPDREIISPFKYKSHPPYSWFGKTLYLITTRGCPGKCYFCSKSVFKNTIRSMSPERIYKEIRYWQNIFDFDEIRFFDDDFTIQKKRTRELCDLFVQEKLNLPWSCTTRVDFLTFDLLKKMKQAGLYLITLGVESGSSKILKVLRKGYTVEHIKNAFKWCRELGIYTGAFFIAGNPEETDEDIRMTLDLQKEIKPNFLTWSTLRVLPGSPLFDEHHHKYDHFAFPDNPYYALFRKDLDEKKLLKFCNRIIFKHYFTPVGFKSALKYILKTKQYKSISEYFKFMIGKH